MTAPALPAGKRSGPSQLGAHVAGYAAVFVLMALRVAGPELLRSVEVDVARGHVEPRELEEARRTWAAIQEAAQAHLTWRSLQSPQRFCDSAEEPSVSGLTVKQAATRLGVTPNRVYQLLAQGRLPGTRGAGGRWVVDELAVELRKVT